MGAYGCLQDKPGVREDFLRLVQGVVLVLRLHEMLAART